MEGTVLVVDDEKKLCEIISLFLQAEGLKVLKAYSGREALEAFKQHSVDLVILDIMLPDISGYDVCKEIRSKTDVPILFLSALSDDDYYMLGYRAGADDYISKPFKASILTMKVKRIMEVREKLKGGQNPQKNSIVMLDESSYKCTVKGTEVHLTQKEFELLSELMRSKGRVLTREYLMKTIWDYDFLGDSRVVDTHIKKLRKKLGDASGYVKTVISVGYKYEEEE
jgi:DNA-binding response OmpR family regulator